MNATGSLLSCTSANRIIDTIITSCSALLVATTYVLLATKAARLNAIGKIIFRAMCGSTGHIFSATWPDRCRDDMSLALDHPGAIQRNAIKLLYVKHTIPGAEFRPARGVCDCGQIEQESRTFEPFLITSGGVLTQSLIQLMIWESVGVWLTATMLYKYSHVQRLPERTKRPEQ